MACDFSDKSKYFIEVTTVDFQDMKVHQLQNLYHALTGEELTIEL